MAEGSGALRRATEALELLLGRTGAAGTASGSLQATQSAALLESLSSRLAALEEKFSQDPHWGELRRLRAEIGKDVGWAAPCPDPPWSFTAQVLLLLLCLKRCMTLLAAGYCPPPPGSKVAEAAPPLSPDTLSISQEKTVRAALQLVATLGLCPYLLPGVGLPLRHRTEFSTLVQHVVSPGSTSGATRRLHATCTALLEIAQHPSLGSILLTRHLGDLLAGLCQLAFGPTKRKGDQAKLQEDWTGLTEEERTCCREALRGLLDRVYQPLVVRELLILQGGSKQASYSSGREGEHRLAPAPAWLRRLCGQLLSERLIRPGGVQAVIRGILEGAGAGAVGGRDAEAAAADWRKCDSVARILSSCPQQSLSLEDYYRQVCPQILQLLLIQDQLIARQFQRVAVTTALTMAREHPQQAEKYLLTPLLEPLLRCLEGAELPLEDLPAGAVLVKEEELTGCVENVFKVYLADHEPSAMLLGSLQPALGAIFSLCCFTKQNVSFLRAPCQEILRWFLEKHKREAALSFLEGLARLGGGIRFLHPLCQFRAASEGGAVIAVREAVGDDEEEELYQKVSSEQWQLEQLVDLLSLCQGSGLAGDLFLHCLKELTHVAGQGGPKMESVLPSDKSSLNLEQCCNPSLEPQERELCVLRLVAMLCETISDALFTDISQVVEFVAATLQRACVSGGVVEAQTLSMAMGLVAAILGGAVQLKSADFAALKQLVPLLEEVSRVHPEPVIQELAADLRITICTHGAFSPESVCLAARSSLGKREAREAAADVGPAERPQGKAPEPTGTLSQTHPEERNAATGPAATASGKLDSLPGAQALRELLLAVYDSDIPSRAAALRSLSHLIEQRDPEVLKIRDKLLKVFLESLDHEDSFVYLSAIQGVALLSDAFPEEVLPSLLARYEGSPQGTREAWPVETRMKVGEALMRSTRALGDLVFSYRDRLVHVFLRGARDPDVSLRASSLSNLGELCQILRFQLGSVIHEVTLCLAAIVKCDRQAEVRRAAVHVVVLLLRGLGESATEVLRDVLLELYRLLKFVARGERDEVTVLQAQLALEELDAIVRRFLFPPQSLEKKIVVLP
ncbi:transport and Golgi organization protein 6 homolog [Heteronotia binoei]|uniref:transport and Golgi organization protein 6 homolog n=1 Tax=Heteronotia binoei TaxID=13085 RepID=UPI002930BBC4|nr:transport and Golgi organization protein 6 homolog [Heteronotia binoei]